jgi:hypothetical protein
MLKRRLIALCLIASALATVPSARAQETRGSGPEQAPATTVSNVWPGVAPGSEQWKQPETVLGSGNNRTIVTRLMERDLGQQKR